MSKYALEISEDTIDLIEHLNSGVSVVIEEETTYFVFDMPMDEDSINEVVSEATAGLMGNDLVYLTVQ